jgi:hypothetical protein
MEFAVRMFIRMFARHGVGCFLRCHFLLWEEGTVFVRHGVGLFLRHHFLLWKEGTVFIDCGSAREWEESLF